MFDLCIIALLSVMADALLPEGSFQKYAKMVSGLLVLFLLIRTLAAHQGVVDFHWEIPSSAMNAEAAIKEQEVI